MLGVGSGIVVIPALVLFMGFEQRSAQGTALAIMVPMAFIGAIRYWRNPQVELHGVVIFLLALGAVAGTMVGTELAARLSVGALRKVFALILMMAAIRMFTASPRPGKTHVRDGASRPSSAEAVERPDGNDSQTH